MTARAEQLDLAGGWWVVHEFAFPFGVGKELGRIQAVDRHQAERKAVEEFQRRGSELHISHAGAKPRRDSLGRPRHAGNSGRRA